MNIAVADVEEQTTTVCPNGVPQALQAPDYPNSTSQSVLADVSTGIAVVDAEEQTTMVRPDLLFLNGVPHVL